MVENDGRDAGLLAVDVGVLACAADAARRAVWAIALLSLCAACSKAEPKPEPGPTPAAPAPAVAQSATPAAAAASAPSGAAVTWAEPQGFQRVESRGGMRKATYVVPRASGDSEDGELAVFYFGAAGGSIEANLQRWSAQFTGVDAAQIKRDQRSSNGLIQHTIEIPSGTFSSGMPGGPTTPKPGYGLLGAIVVAPGGNYFFKLTGPSKTVTKARAEFYKLLDSVKAG